MNRSFICIFILVNSRLGFGIINVPKTAQKIAHAINCPGPPIKTLLNILKERAE